MPDDALAQAAVVVLMTDALAAALVEGFPRDDDLVVVILVVLAVDDLTAGCRLAGEAPSAFMLPSFDGAGVSDTPNRVGRTE